jgi:nucleoside 2-deoxyribosyltransferase
MTTPQVFISYTRSDGDWARSFAEALKQRGLRVWFDQFQIAIGDPLREALEAGLRESDVLVALIDPGSSLKPNLFFELGAAIGMGKRVVAIVPRQVDTSKLPFELRSRRYLLRDSPEDTAEQLAHDLAAA